MTSEDWGQKFHSDEGDEPVPIELWGFQWGASFYSWQEIMYALCLSSPSATFALQHGGYVPREWLVAKCYFDGWRLNFGAFDEKFSLVL